MALFQANIPNDITIDELVEQLYVFLNSYVPRRLIYEGTAEREDCIQETIMYLLDRYKSLTEQEKLELNLEKFFYNRSRSYISLYIRKLKKQRKDQADYIDMCRYLKQDVAIDSIYFVDEQLLDKIISRYRLNKYKLELLKEIVSSKLVNMFSTMSTIAPEIEEEDSELLNKLAIAIIDEYIVEKAILEVQDKEEELGEG